MPSARALLATIAAMVALAVVAPVASAVPAITTNDIDVLASNFFADSSLYVAPGSSVVEQPVLDASADPLEPAPTLGASGVALDGFPAGAEPNSIALSSGLAANQWSGGGDGNWTDVAGGAHGSLYDVSVLRFKFTLPADSQCVRFDYRILSQESLSDSFDEGLIAQVDQTEFSFDGGTNVLTAPNDFATHDGNPAFQSYLAADQLAAPTDTIGYGNITPVYSAISQALTPGEHTLQLAIFDDGDNEVDTGAQLAGFRAASGTDCDGSTVIQKVDPPVTPPVVPPVVPAPPSNVFTLGKFISGNGTGKIALTLASAGTVTVYDSKGPKVSVSRAAAAKAKKKKKKIALIKKVTYTGAAGTTSIKLKPTSAGKKVLKKKGKLKVRLAIVFHATGNGALNKKYKTITIKKKKK